jgi:hypothetical protein
MSFFKRLFGRKKEPKVKLRPTDSTPASSPTPAKPASNPKVEEPFVPGQSRAAARPLYHHLPEGTPEPTLKETTNLLRIDAILTMANYTGEEHDFDCGPEDLLIRKMTDDNAILIPMVMTHKQTGLKHPVFFAYTEEEAAYFPYYAREMAKEDGWGAAHYYGIIPFEKLPAGDELPRPDPIGFIDLFELKKDFQPPEGNYSLWNRTNRESFLPNSPLLPILDVIYTRLAGYESLFAGLLLSSWQRKEMDGRMPLPQEDFTMALVGPEKVPTLVTFSEKRGIVFSTPTSVSAAYRNRMHKHYMDFAVQFADMMDQKEELEKDPEPAGGYPVKWFKDLKEQIITRHQGAHIIVPFQLGDKVEAFSSDMQYDVDDIPMAFVFPRVIHLREEDVNPQTTNIRVGTNDGKPLEAEVYSVPFVGQLHIAYAVDRGDHFTYVNKSHFTAMTPADQERLHEVALENLANEISGKISFRGSPDLFGIVEGTGDYEAATMLLPAFWEKLEPVFGGDLVTMVLSRGQVLVSRLTNAEGMEKMQEFAANLKEQIPEHKYYDDTVYYRGPVGTWSVT